MPISVKCPECEAPYKVPDEAAGKAIKCKKCGAKISIPAAEADPGDGGGNDFAGIGPGAEGGADAGGETKEKKKAGSKKMLLIIGAVVLVLGCCCVLPVGGGGLGWWLGWFGVAKEKNFQIKDKDNPVNIQMKDVPIQKKSSLDRKDPLAPKEPPVAVLSRSDLPVEFWVSSADFANTLAQGRRWYLASVAAGST
jgi:predicted Zn finger-like uncharacterized protein